MRPGHYTELFFLDEATALAAGHRPCAECQRARYNLFRETWAASRPQADEIDRVLHAERLNAERRKRTYLAPVSELPAGVFVADGEGIPYLVLDERLVRWEPGGYTRSIPKPPGADFQVLTPASTVRAISLGYPVTFHPSAKTAASRSG